MKIAMNKVYDELIKAGIDAKIVLQVHDELIIEASEKDKEQAKQILRNSMENAVKLDIPLKVELEEAKTWYDAK
jgi:DNA polymerase-1